MARRAGTAHLVADLGEARDARRLRDHRAKLGEVVNHNKRALARLFQTGLIYTRQGARLGRDLLLAHQQLLKVGELLARVGELAARGCRAGGEDIEALYDEMHRLLARTSDLTARSDGLISREL